MSAHNTAIIVLAAGQGTRMKSAVPKVMHEIAGRPMIGHVMAAADGLQPARKVVVAGPDMTDVQNAVAPAETVVQDPRLGTAHAVIQARETLKDFTGTVLIVYGDTPLLRPETLEAMVGARRAASAPAIVVLAFRAAAPGAYGRVVTDAEGGVERIVEARDATPAEQEIDLCNSGVMAVDGGLLFEFLDAVSNDNAKGEYYLTDIVAIARNRGYPAAVVETAEEDVLGVNSRAELAAAEAVYQNRLRRYWMAEGVTMTAPETVFLSHDTRLSPDVTIGPNVVFGAGVTVAEGAAIHAFSHITGAVIAAGADIGPFARLRPGADIGVDAHIGNFVEVKNAVVGEGAKANHLSYLGDAWVGPEANIGAGTITCNYDGVNKHLTVIGRKAFIGSNTTLVPPVTVEDGGLTGAGSVITESVPADGLALSRAEQVTKPGAGKRFMERKAQEKAAGKGPKPDPQAVDRNRNRT